MKKRIVALATALIGIALVAPIASAADVQHGQTGTYAVMDTRAQPSATCVYPDNWGALQGVRVHAPSVWAADTAAGADTQLVGWRFIVKRVAQTTTIAYRSSIQTATATDTEPAALADMAGSFTSSGGAGTPRYVVVIKMFWYGEGNEVLGWAKHRVQHYDLVTVSGNDGGARLRCPFGLA